jgi:peptidoglycan biosynthesis protein MviN/MurJ (putative lipid II flippase)
MVASFASIALNIVLNVTLMQVMGFLAFPLSTTIAAVLNIALLIILLPKKVGKVDLAPLGRYFGALTAASAAGGAVGWFLYRILIQNLGASFWTALGLTVVCGSLALGLFYFLTSLFGISEAKAYLRRFFNRSRHL